MSPDPLEPDAKRPVLYQICRAGDRFEVGDGPFDLSRLRVLVLGRGQEGGYDARANEDVIRVADPWMSGRHASITRDGSRHVLKDLGSTNGVLVNSRRMADGVLESGDLLETGRTFWVYLQLPGGQTPPIEPTTFGEMASWSPVFAAQLATLGRLAKPEACILLTGEQGVGKEYCGKAIHQVSGRAGRLIHVDLHKLPPQRQLQELMGREDVRAGAVCLSSGGTLLIHRMELLGAEGQQALLDALQTGRVVGPGGGRPINVDLHLVASTEGDLKALVKRGRFNPALWELLAQNIAHIPPLRERREDLGLLLDALLIRAGGAHSITRDACRALLNYPWPRNVRELSKVLEGGAILAGDDEAVDLRHLPGVIAGRSGIHPEMEALITGETEQPELGDPDVTSPGDDDGGPFSQNTDDLEEVEAFPTDVDMARAQPSPPPPPPHRPPTRVPASPPPPPPPPPVRRAAAPAPPAAPPAKSPAAPGPRIIGKRKGPQPR